MEEYHTERGFKGYLLRDLNDKKFRVQESSLATQKAIWIFVDENAIHLNKETVTELISLLQKFLPDGEK